MTAFAGNEAVIDNLTVICELRSVNHRYCDITVKLPERLRFVEMPIRNAIAAKIKRGKVECSLSYKKQPQAFNIDMKAVEALLGAARSIESLMSDYRPFSALDVLAYPGIQQESDTDNDRLQQGIGALVDGALTQMLEVRAREGAELAAMIEDRCEKMKIHVDAARRRMPDVLTHLREKMKVRIHEIAGEPDFDRFEQELVYLAQKLDVAEELDRLETHINEVSRVLGDPEPVGRRLDFLMQEMNREANTLGSKSADKEMTAIAIELKVLIEQMREQVQNIE
ncbi:MAG: YicC family protein [Methylomicrobium sp.]